MDKKISIIIPVYNVEQYIEKCLQSCINQDLPHQDYEIIVINDGSTDGSLEVVNRVTTDYSNFIIINKPNEGASSARNKGLDIASGNYVWFIDADDWIETNCLQSLIFIMEQEQLDALQIGYHKVINSKTYPFEQKFRKTTPVMSPKEYVNPDLFVGGTCGTIFKREIATINSIRFDEQMRIAEDQLFFLCLFKFAKRVKRVNRLVYYYLSNPNSLMLNVTEEQLLQSVKTISDIFPKSPFSLYIKHYIVSTLVSLMSFPKVDIKRLNSELRFYQVTGFIGSRDLRKIDRFKLLLYKYFGKGFLVLYNKIS